MRSSIIQIVKFFLCTKMFYCVLTFIKECFKHFILVLSTIKKGETNVHQTSTNKGSSVQNFEPVPQHFPQY